MMEIERQSELMGATVSGIDLSGPLDKATCQSLKTALLTHHLLCFRGQSLTPLQFADAGRLFGKLQVQLLSDYRLPDVQEVTVISNYNKMTTGKPHVRATNWHTDDSYFAQPAMATMLLAKALPTKGGRTEFINTHAVFDALPEHLRQRIEGCRAVHKYQSRRAKAPVAVRTPEEEVATPDVSHSLIRTHPETGRAALYINPNRIDHVVGMEPSDSDILLDELYDFAFQPQFRHHHDWQLGDMVIWDNRCTMHRATTNFDINERREFQRILLKGTVPE
jgi:taurine dioxygenase